MGEEKAMADEEKLKGLEERLGALEKDFKFVVGALKEFAREDFHTQNSKASKDLNKKLLQIR